MLINESHDEQKGKTQRLQTPATMQLFTEFLRPLSSIECATIQLESLNTGFKTACRYIMSILL